MSQRPSLWFVMPAHGRHDIARVCMQQLAWTCADLRFYGVDAYAVVIACDANLDVAQELGFGTVERDNQQLGRRWNDGYQLAWREGVDYVVPIGSDDWLDPTWIWSKAGLPAADTIRCMTQLAMVDETGRRIRRMQVRYPGGAGVRIIPTRLLDQVDGRPCVEDRQRAIDATTLRRLQQANPQLKLEYVDAHPYQLIDWKTTGVQLNPFGSCEQYAADTGSDDPFQLLPALGVFPDRAIDQMRRVYHHQEVAV